MKTALYRHYDKDNRLLYVGISLSAINRMITHKLSSEWSNESVRMDTEWFEDKETALKMEKEAIVNERPLFNIMHNDISYDAHYKEYIIINTNTKSSIYCLDELPSAKLRIWDYLVFNMGNMNMITVSQSQLADKLEIHKNYVNRMLKNFEQVGLIVKCGKSQHNNIYMINPDKFWRGSPKDIKQGKAIFVKYLNMGRQTKDADKVSEPAALYSVCAK